MHPFSKAAILPSTQCKTPVDVVIDDVEVVDGSSNKVVVCVSTGDVGSMSCEVSDLSPMDLGLRVLGLGFRI